MLHILYIIAIIAEAITASLSAGRRDMDWVGVLIISWITALGGGTIRNMFLGHYPMSWVEHPEYLVITAVAAISTVFIAKFMKHLKKLFLFLDAVGLVVFTIIGCQVAQDLDMPAIIVILSGMVTGCAGGILRDVLCNDVPLIFQKEVYASASLLTGAIYLSIFYGFGGEYQHYATVAAFFIGLCLRLCAMKYEWQMPKFVYRDEWH